MKEHFAPSMADEKLRRLCIVSRWKGFNKRGFGFFGVGNDNVFVDIIQVNFLGSEKVSFPVGPLFLLASSMHICFNGTELTKVDSSQFKLHGSDGDFWRGIGSPIVMVFLTILLRLT